jgi:hypothetical protein
MLKKKYFKTKSEVEVTFELRKDEARKAELVCEANGWEPVDMKKAKDGSFRTRMRFPTERRFQFRYLVDDNTWVDEEQADAFCRNEFGGRNSILVTSEAR